MFPPLECTEAYLMHSNGFAMSVFAIFDSCQTDSSMHFNGGGNSSKINEESEQSQIKFAKVLEGALMIPSI